MTNFVFVLIFENNISRLTGMQQTFRKNARSILSIQVAWTKIACTSTSMLLLTPWVTFVNLLKPVLLLGDVPKLLKASHALKCKSLFCCLVKMLTAETW